MASEIFSIFILKSQAGIMVQAENFLKNRNWVVGSATNLREALAYIIQKNPQYVFLTCDHPNKKVRVLPKMLVQAFPVRIIGFAEKSTGASQRLLTEMGLEYNLYPPVSGPAIERIILKMKKDDEAKAQAALTKDRPAGEAGPADQGAITFKGETTTGDQMKTSFEQARAALSQLVSSADPAEDTTEDSTAQTGGFQGGAGPMIQQGSKQPSGPAYMGGAAGATTPASQTGAAYNPTQNSQGPAYNPTQGSGMGSGYTPGQGSQSGPAYNPTHGNSNNSGSGFNPNSGQPNSGGYSPEQEQQPGESFEHWSERMKQEAGKEKPKPGKDSSSPFGALDNSDPSTSDNSAMWDSLEAKPSGSATQAGAKQTPIMESGDIAGKSDWNFQVEPGEKEDLSKQSIIVRGTQQALDETALKNDGKQIQKVEKSSNIACITVQSPKFNGYLVCAMGKNRTIDKNFIDSIQTRLFGFLKSNGESISEKDTMDMKIQEVDFTDWALEQAEFLRKSVHEGDEIAMAFFPTQESLDLTLEDSLDEKMVMINLSELKEDVDLEFDLYIYMPENNKYLLYTPEGRPFYGKQKNRLEEKGVSQMHLRKESTHNVKKYRAQNFLNEKIAAYKQAAAIKKLN